MIRLLMIGCLFSLLWASAFVAGKFTLLYLPPFSILFIRFGLAGVGLLAWTACVDKQRFWRDKTLLKRGAMLGILNNSLYLGLSFLALQHISAALITLLVATAPFMTTVLTIALTRKVFWVQVASVILGFVGVYVVVGPQLGQGQSGLGVAYALLATLAFSAGTLYYRFQAAQYEPLAINGVQNLAAAATMLPLVSDWAALPLALSDAHFLGLMAFQVLGVSVTCILLWLYLVRKIGAAHASAFHLLNPICGLFLSALFFHTAVSARDLLGGLLVVAAMGLVSWDVIQRHSSKAA